MQGVISYIILRKCHDFDSACPPKPLPYKVSFSILWCTLGEFEICTTSYPRWLSAKQYTIGEFFSFTLGKLSATKLDVFLHIVMF